MYSERNGRIRYHSDSLPALVKLWQHEVNYLWGYSKLFYFQIVKLPPTIQPQASDYLLKKTKSNNHNHTISKCVITTSSLFPLCNWRILQSTRVVVSLRVRSVCFWSPNSIRSSFCCFYLFLFFLNLNLLILFVLKRPLRHFLLPFLSFSSPQIPQRWAGCKDCATRAAKIVKITASFRLSNCSLPQSPGNPQSLTLTFTPWLTCYLD